MTPLEFHQIYSFWNLRDDPEATDKKEALFYTEFSDPPLVERFLKISKEGEKFLKQNEK